MADHHRLDRSSNYWRLDKFSPNRDRSLKSIEFDSKGAAAASGGGGGGLLMSQMRKPEERRALADGERDRQQLSSSVQLPRGREARFGETVQ